MILLITFTALHLAITILFSIKIISWRSKGSTVNPTISIIIAARNEYENLNILIPKLLEQDYENFDISFGLDRCDDQSVRLLESFESPKLTWVDIQEVPTDWNPKKYALHEAIKPAKGEWLVFTDADCFPASAEWLASLSKEMSDGTGIVLGVSPYQGGKNLLGGYIQYEAFMTYFIYAAMCLLGRPYMAVGRNFAIRKELFFTMGGYRTIQNIQGGDDDLLIQKSDRSKVKMALGPSSLVYTLPAISWKQYFQQKIRHFSVSSHYSVLDKMILSTYHLVHALFFILLTWHINHAFLWPIGFFYLFIKLVSYRFVAHRIGAGVNNLLIPIVDGMYALFTPMLGIASKLVKDIKWKN